MQIIIDEHAKVRAEERGVSVDEILDILNSAIPTVARNNRSAKEKVYIYNKEWNGKVYTHKQVKVIYIVESSTIIVITVVVKYGTFKI
ncbi:MAG: DUF4258 domain-containing protein [Chitinophagaceae bacterium]|nr:DUF4258 domain-containing protein [Chitinophagaceae bacterium]